MFDDLRSQVSPFDEDGEQPAKPPRSGKSTGTAKKSATATHSKAASKSAAVEEAPRRVVRRKKKKAPSETPLLGLTAVQRFVISIMMFMIVAVFGLVLLLATGSMVLPL